ncbi:MAG: hypothetical protein IH588_08590 [Anaerolineales bacterium]|nr:hypothetical protein [Anaerolineales bacterium]
MLTTPQTNAPVPNELEWISNFLSFERKLTGEDIENVRNFSLLWNLFERLVCHRNASIPALVDAISRLQRQDKLRIDDYEIFLKYFANRYIEGDKPNHRFRMLNLRGDDKTLVEAVLKGSETTPEKVMLALLMIVYRYRNNLFHGEKSIRDLPNQIENFRNANQLLMIFMERWR